MKVYASSSIKSTDDANNKNSIESKSEDQEGTEDDVD